MAGKHKSATDEHSAKPAATKKATLKAAAAKARAATTKHATKKRAPRPVTDAERARVRELHAQGLGRNEIARKVKRSVATVTKIVQAAGGAFDRAATAQAVAARVEDMKARRLEIAELLLTDIPKLHERLWSPHRYYERGATELIPVELPLPPLRDVRDGYGAIGLALRGHVDMMRESSAATTETKRSVLGDLLDGLKAAYDADKASAILSDGADDGLAGDEP